MNLEKIPELRTPFLMFVEFWSSKPWKKSITYKSLQYLQLSRYEVYKFLKLKTLLIADIIKLPQTKYSYRFNLFESLKLKKINKN